MLSVCNPAAHHGLSSPSSEGGERDAAKTASAQGSPAHLSRGFGVTGAHAHSTDLHTTRFWVMCWDKYNINGMSVIHTVHKSRLKGNLMDFSHSETPERKHLPLIQYRHACES